MLLKHVHFDLHSRKEQGLLRQRVVKQAKLCDFSSNDYLGLSTDPRVQALYQYGFTHYPTGSGGSMLVSGYHAIHQAFEEAFCEALRAPSAVLFSSGYAANLGIMALLAESSLTALFDKAMHASLYDGIKLAGTCYQRFSHQAYDSLSQMITSIKAPAVLFTESVYSMGGHFTPLDKLSAMTKGLKGMIVDEAHAFGLYGQEGLGAVAHFQLTAEDVPLRVIPLGKALGAQGAMVVGQADWIEALIQVARGYIYSTGLSPAYVYGMKEAFQLLRKANEARARLFENVAYFKELVRQTACAHWLDSTTPIQHFRVGCPQKALDLADFLLNQGIFVRAMRPPTVPIQSSGLRVVLNANHTKAQLLQLISVLDAAR